jgi:hypothetical protein
MLADGFEIVGFDGRTTDVAEFDALAAPVPLYGVRADACGIHNDSGLLGFAEAKTATDIDNQHTRAQLRVLGHTRMRGGERCPLYLAIPRGSAYRLDRVLIDSGLIGARHVRRIHVPEALLAGLER